MKEREKKKSRASWKSCGHRVRYYIIYEEELRRLIDKDSKHKMILLNTRGTKERFERALKVPNKMEYSAFEDVDRIEGILVSLSNK